MTVAHSSSAWASSSVPSSPKYSAIRKLAWRSVIETRCRAFSLDDAVTSSDRRLNIPPTAKRPPGVLGKAVGEDRMCYAWSAIDYFDRGHCGCNRPGLATARGDRIKRRCWQGEGSLTDETLISPGSKSRITPTETQMSKLIRVSDEVFTIPDLCSAQECDHWIVQSETLGYEEATINSEHGPRRMPDVRNNARVIVDDSTIANELWQRIASDIPYSLKAREAVGLNERLRYYRYDIGQKFDWHADGCVRLDGGLQSMLTFMVYFSKDFGGECDHYQNDFGAELIMDPKHSFHAERSEKVLDPFDHGCLLG